MEIWNYLWHFIFCLFLWHAGCENQTRANNGSYTSMSTSRSSPAASDSPSPGGSSPVPSSSTPSNSQGSTEAELTMTSQPSMALTSSGPASSAGLQGSVTVLTTTALTQGQTTVQMASTSASTDRPLSSTAPASPASQDTTRHSTGGSPTTTHLSGTTDETNVLTSSVSPATSLAAASMTTSDSREASTENEPMRPSGTASTTGVSGSSQATSVAAATVRPDTSSTAVATASGSAGSVSPVPSLLSSFFTTSLGPVSLSNFNPSSSYIPPSPALCSPVTLSIQLENVTSKTIQFSWKPQGGTRDSPYHVRLWEGPREMENRSLNETSTAFGSLLSDHEYQVSVDVLTCSKNVSTSMTVRTVAKVFNGTTRITNKDFIPEYLNKSSTEFKKFEAKFIEEIKKHLPAVILKLIEEGKMRIVINSLTNGSVIASFSIVLDGGENVTKTEISDAFTEALNMSTVLKADLKKTIIEARNSCQPGLNDCSQNATCSAEGATYSCQCNERFTDNSPRVPGRVCQLKQNPPSQQITTVPPESAMGRSTGTTTSSPFATTFTSGACMPVFIKVENVSAEAIRLSWTSEDGKRGSLYTVFLMDGIQEINKTTTNETTITFKDLLPGHVYTISVEVLSCTENSRSSVRVRTDPVSCFNRTDFCLSQNRGCPDLKYIICSNYQSFACRALLKKQIFNDSLYDTDSGGYKAISESIKTEIVTEMRIKLKDDHFDIMVLGFRPGSVIVYFISVLQKQEPVDVKVVQEYLSQILKSKFGDQTEVQVQSLSTQSSTGKSSSWKVAVIVLGVLLGVALVLIFLLILVYIWRKKSSGKYLVEPTGLLGNFVYKHL
ncbi:mucin-19-like [Numida meleagris]|uniref:mucin-19-like n=1 Tax=Numida meleagris TaxID=8996 RepID=UPI000B3E141C|nr:mucin-19-like [Numida meleagris]